jgi:hypothetical protein
MAEATSTLSTEQTTGTWRTQLTTIELHHMATTSLVTSFVKLILAAYPLTLQFMSLMSPSLPAVKLDVA